MLCHERNRIEISIQKMYHDEHINREVQLPTSIQWKRARCAWSGKVHPARMQNILVIVSGGMLRKTFKVVSLH